MSFSGHVNHLQGVIGHVGVPFVILAEGIQTTVCLCLTDIADDLVDDRVRVSIAGNDVGIGGGIFSALGSNAGDSDGFLVSVRPFEAQPLAEALGGRHLGRVAQEFGCQATREYKSRTAWGILALIKFQPPLI